jgi:alpha-beta hydrolase superfamily lysophospholipase
MKHRDMEFPGCRDTNLYGQAWLPESLPRAVIAVSHGLAEHGGRYAALAERLVDKGFAVYALDHRGHGRSGGPRANIERFDYLVSDLGTFVGRAQREHPGVPIILLGHSMGGTVALGCALKYENALRALVLSAPALAVAESPSLPKRLIVKALSFLRPDTGVMMIPARAVSRDAKVVRAYEADPMVFHGAIPARTVAELLEAMRILQQRVHELRLPVLIQHGSADELVPLSTTHAVYRHLGLAKRRTMQVYDGLYHEIYNEPERERVIADLVSWLAV